MSKFFNLLHSLANWFFTIGDDHPTGRYHVVTYEVEEGKEPPPGTYEVEYWDGQPTTIKQKDGDHVIDEVIRNPEE